MKPEDLLLAAELDPAKASQFLKKYGFKEGGRMGKVGFKFDRWIGTVLMQKSLK